MAAGSAIITTDQTGCREVVGDTALLVPAGDDTAIRSALRQLAADSELRAKLGTAARQRIEEFFSWPAVTGQYLDVFNRVIADNPRLTSVGEAKP
jgi:glycosyltransferase involved in cell wall biosynthesis